MPQIAKGPRLWLRKGKDGRDPIWVIKDGKRRFSTGTKDRAKSEQILASYKSCPKHFLNVTNRRKRTDPRKLRWLYFIEIQAEDKPVKIGIANDVRARLWNIGVGSPFECRLVASAQVAHAVEAAVHELVEDYRIKGEWFKRAPIVVELIQATQAGTLMEYLATNGTKPVRRIGTEKGETHASP